MAQALLRFLDNQYLWFDGEETKFVEGVFGIFGHGCVVGIGEALADENNKLPFYQAKNEQGAVHAATAFAKEHNRRKIMAVTSSIGPGALNMVVGAGTATANHIPVLLLPGDVFACRQPDPVLQQIEIPTDYTNTANDAFRSVSRYWDRVNRPEQLMSAMLNAMRVLTDPAETGAVTIALPQDVQGMAYDYPAEFFAKRVHYVERRIPTQFQLDRLAKLIAKAESPWSSAAAVCDTAKPGMHWPLSVNGMQFPSAKPKPAKEQSFGTILTTFQASGPPAARRQTAWPSRVT
jgi:3D-(3,5/4)-trihydroxycyclohexane-1,2-dione acylhydrolase (decyclizing)